MFYSDPVQIEKPLGLSCIFMKINLGRIAIVHYIFQPIKQGMGIYRWGERVNIG
jgi:hypothetical protein